MCFGWGVGEGEVVVADVTQWIGLLFSHAYCRSAFDFYT
jgi:hypothetical protein